MPEPPDKVTKRFGAFLVDLNKKGWPEGHTWTQEKLAEIFDMSQSQIGNYMSDKISTTNSRMLLTSIEKFNVNPWYFFGAYKDKRNWRDFPNEDQSIYNAKLADIYKGCIDIIEKIKEIEPSLGDKLHEPIKRPKAR